MKKHSCSLSQDVCLLGFLNPVIFFFISIHSVWVRYSSTLRLKKASAVSDVFHTSWTWFLFPDSLFKKLNITAPRRGNRSLSLWRIIYAVSGIWSWYDDRKLLWFQSGHPHATMTTNKWVPGNKLSKQQEPQERSSESNTHPAHPDNHRRGKHSSSSCHIIIKTEKILWSFTLITRLCWILESDWLNTTNNLTITPTWH